MGRAKTAAVAVMPSRTVVTPQAEIDAYAEEFLAKAVGVYIEHPEKSFHQSEETGVITAYGHSGRIYYVTPHKIDKQVKLLFTTGHCHSLALQLNKQYGWEIGAVDVHDSYIDHVFNILPDGRMIDIEGIYDGPEETWAEEMDFEGTIHRNVTPADLQEYTHEKEWLEPDFKLAALFSSEVEKYTKYSGTARNYSYDRENAPGYENNNYPLHEEADLNKPVQISADAYDYHP